MPRAIWSRKYYLGPADGAEKVYALLVKAMESSGLSAVARYVFHDKQQHGALRIRDGIITLENMYPADEILRTRDIVPGRKPRVDKREVEKAQTLIERLTTSFDHDKYEDEYRERVLKIMKRKRKGEDVHATPEEEREPTTDLLEALRASVEATRGSTNRKGKPGRRRRAATKAR